MKRTKLVIKGSLISIIASLLIGFLTFYRTGAIISTLGVQINSIVQVADQVLSYLILLETGLGAAYLFKMFEPFSKNDFEIYNRLYSGYKFSMKKIAIRMILVLGFVSILYPIIIEKNDIGYIKITLVFIILGLRFIFPYYFTLHLKSILIINEKQYFVILVESIKTAIILIIEIVFIKYTNVDLTIILLAGLLINWIVFAVFDYICRRNYPYVMANEQNANYSPNKMTKYIIVHQIASMTNSKIDTLILSVTNLNLVTVYSAFDSIVSYPVTLFVKIIDVMRAPFGIKFAMKDKNTFDVFMKLFTIMLFSASIITTVFIIMANDFVTLWIGEFFTVDKITIYLFSVLLFNRIIIFVVYVVRDANGLYRQSKNYTISATLINLVLSLSLVFLIGMKGLLIATIASNIFVLNFFNIRLVYQKVFNKKQNIYYYFILSLFQVLLSLFIYRFILNFLYIKTDNMILSFIYKSLIISSISFIISYLVQTTFNSFFRDLQKNLYGHFFHDKLK